MSLTAATLFSGIGAPETAMPGWNWAWSAEIDKFPAAVLAARHPHTVNLGDVSADDFTSRARDIASPDVLVFGSPCQDFSVAGKRLGLDGARGNLALTALRIVGELRPDWFVFENVPGLLSNWSGASDGPLEEGAEWEGVENSDFAAFLGTVDELRYLGSWAGLDAQYCGLAQRRDRLFFVGHSRDWRYPAAVLFEPESLSGYSAPRREAGQRTSPTLNARTAAGGGLGTDHDINGGLIASHDVAQPLLAKGNSSHRADAESYVAMALNAKGGSGRIDGESETFVAHALRADGFDASEDGTGRGTPIVAFSCKDHGADASEIAPTMRAMGHSGSHANAGGQIAVAYQCQGTNVGEMGTLRKGDGGVTSGVPFIADPITASFARHKGASGGKDSLPRNHIVTSGVRRLTPRECERLQGYPDDYTLISYRGKPAADGPRYKALGNSMAVPVMRWILERIEKFTHGPSTQE